MKNNCAFTIVAKNYIGLAKVLRESIKQVSPEIDFYIFVADERSESFNDNDESDLVWGYESLFIERDAWINMAFKYNLTEFCTAIKPFCFRYLFDNLNYKKAIYFDPDIYVFSDLSFFFSLLDSFSVVLTPHISQISLNNDSEKTFLQSGIYNLGFLALSNTVYSESILRWWSKKLLDSCFDDVLDYTFTDQKWMNFIPAFLPSEQYYIERGLGSDVAPWNYCERKIIFKDEKPISVVGREIDNKIEHPLRFIHFSGYDYRGMIAGKEHRTRRRSYVEDFEDVKQSNTYYTQILRERSEEFLKYLNLPYTYGFFSNGVLIDKFHRRLYRSLSNREKVDSPFSCEGIFYKRLSLIKAISYNKNTAITEEGDYSSKLARFNTIMRFVYKILGCHRYVALLRLLKYFSKFESQIFLIDKKYNGNSIDILNKK